MAGSSWKYTFAVATVLVLISPRLSGADVETQITLRTDPVLEWLTQEIRPGRERYVVLNGNLLRTRLGHTSLRPNALVRQLQNLAQREAQSIAETPASARPTGASDPKGDYTRSTAALFRAGHPFEGDGWASYVHLDPAIAADPTVLISLPEDPSSELGFIATATRGQSDISDVWITYLDDAVSLLTLFPAEDEDAAGGDVPGLPRYPGSRRSMTFSEFSDSGEVHQVSYLGSGGVREHLEHYNRALRKTGLDAAILGDGDSDRGMIQASGEGREVSIFVTRAEGDSALDVIQVRSDREFGR